MDQFKTLLKNKKLRATPHRLALLLALKDHGLPVDAATLHQELVKQGSLINPATVYRILQQLTAASLVKTVNFQDGKIRYELEGDHHHHLVCENCGLVAPIHEDCLAVSSRQVLAKYGFLINHHHLEYFGLCRLCRQDN
jgi:Fur family transcriptional regulator, ferric uptake regulator